MSAQVRASRRAALLFHARCGLHVNEAAGLRKVAVARSTGTLVGVYDAVAAGLDSWGWATVCEDHGRLVLHDSLALANDHSAAPEGWCGVCNGSELPDEDDER